MTSIDAEPLPGTTLNDLIQQHEFLNEFLDLVRKRFELDREYLKKLRALRTSANPKWENSAIWPLISPFLHFFDEETHLREQTSDSLFARLEELPEHDSPDAPDKEGVTASTKYGRLRTSYDKYQGCLSRVNTTESITSLQEWYQRTRVEDESAFNMTAEEIAMHVFPEVDRDYRASVVAQQEEVQLAAQWHDEKLPARLEDHQQRAEEVKLLLRDVSMYYSQFIARLSPYFSMLTSSTAAFSSSRFIAPLYGKRDSEISHLLLRPAVYLNFYTDGSPGRPIFGLKVSDELANNLTLEFKPGVLHLFLDIAPLSIYDAFLIEKDPNASPISHPHPYWSNSASRPKAMLLSFFSTPPLTSLPKGILSHQKDAWTRSKLKDMMREVSNGAKDIMYRWALAQTIAYKDAILLFHDDEAWRIVVAIRRKWDFENDSSLPDGVIRIFNGLKPSLVWKRTWQPYVPPEQ